MRPAPWDVLGPAVESQTLAAIRLRYRRSILVVSGLLGGLILATVIVGEPAKRVATLGQWLLSKGAPAWTPVVLTTTLGLTAVLTLFQLVPAFLVWWEQKVAGHIQIRLGPMRTGLWHGWAQTIADGIKLLLKEDIVPLGADRGVHFWAPIVTMAPAFVCLAPLPFGAGLTAADLDVGVLAILGVSGLSVIGLLMGGWGSNSKYSELGGLRAAAQMVSYEVPRMLSILPVVMWAGGMSLGHIVQQQAGLWGGVLPKWFIFYPVVGQVGFIIYLISTVAETNRVPFDLAEAESELCAGFHTEYSGMKFALFYLAEYAYLFLGSGLGAVLFFGGGNAPWPFLSFIPSFTWFFAKTLLLAFLFLWFRWTYPRLRVDRLMDLCWKFLLPWSLVNVALAGVLILWRAS